MGFKSLIPLRSLAGAFLFIANSGLAQAQDDYPNTCDPSDIFGECQDMALRYEAGSAPFPYDPDRAETLREIDLEHAMAGCGASFSLTDSCGKARDLIMQKHGRIRPSTGLETTGALKILALRDLAEAGCQKFNPMACTARARFDYDTGLLLYRTQVARQSGNDPNVETSAYQIEQSAYLGKAKTAAQLRLTQFSEACSIGGISACVQHDEMKQLLHDLASDEFRTTPVLYPSFLDACLQGQTHNCIKLVSDIAALGLAHVPQHGETPHAVATRFEQECQAGKGPACFSVALLLTTQERDPEDFYGQSCQMGVPHGCEAVAWQAYVQYSEAPTLEALGAAKSLLQKACDMGRNVPCHVLEHLPSQ